MENRGDRGTDLVGVSQALRLGLTQPATGMLSLE